MWCVFNSCFSHLYTDLKFVWMKRKGTTELSSAQPHSTQYSRRMSEADANLHGMCLMLFISSFRVACLCCLLKVLCARCFQYGNEGKQNETKWNKRTERKQEEEKNTHTSSTATATTYRARDKSNRNVENNTQCLRVLPLRSKNRVDESSFANETNTLSPSPSPS